MIELNSVSRTFDTRRGTVHALHDITLHVDQGEFVALIGRSGCGKSTLLRLVAGLLSATGGDVLVDGSRVSKPRRDVAMVLQRPALLPWRSAVGNVLLPVEVFGWPRAQHRRRAHELLEMTGLDSEFHDRMPHELSGGMQQRIALCRALIQRPRVMLMDEPFSALDALTREELTIELQRIHAEYSPTVLLVTHSIDEAVLLADRVAVLSPRPGHITKILDIGIPRPRSRGQHDQIAQIAERSAELYDLLTLHDARVPRQRPASERQGTSQTPARAGGGAFGRADDAGQQADLATDRHQERVPADLAGGKR